MFERSVWTLLRPQSWLVGSYLLGTAGCGPYSGRLATGLILNHVLGRSAVSVG